MIVNSDLSLYEANHESELVVRCSKCLTDLVKGEAVT